MADRLKLASITIVRDEATIVEAFVRHNIRFVDRMYVVDDGSRDATLEIIGLLRQEGLAIAVIDQPGSGAFYQGSRMTLALAHVLSDGAWDAVLPLDADEFLAAESRAAFEQDIGTIPPGSVGGLAPIHYAFSLRDDPAVENDLERIQHGVDTGPRTWKVIVPGCLAGREKAAFLDGNHAFLIDGVAAPSHPLNTRLAHFVARSADEMVARSIVHYIRWRSREDYQQGFTEHRMRLVRAISDSPSFTISAEFAAPIASRLLTGMEPEALVRLPFDASHAVTRFKHLASRRPYGMILTAIDDLIADSRTAAPAAVGERAKELHVTVAALRAELAQTEARLAAAKAELAALKGSSRRLISAALRLVSRRLGRSVSKRRQRWLARLRT